MKNKNKLIAIFSISTSLILGAFSGYFFTIEDSHSLAVYDEDRTLEEEMIHSDLIVRGVVQEELGTFKQDAGVETPDGPFLFDVTTFKIKVDEVIDGTLESDSLVFYQHGSSKDSKASENHVKIGEQVYLILSKRPDGKGYWSYNFDDGIWRIKKSFKGEIVESKTDFDPLKDINNKSTEKFEEVIKDARE